MQYGHFDNANREYVITRPDTPLPWINYLGCDAYFGLISNTAGGYSFYKDARLRRLTRYRYNNAPLDTGGRYIYLRDDAAGDFWSPSWQPARRRLDDYTCRHGLGYTVIGSTYRGIEGSTRYFVPLGENLEIWQLTLTNHRAEPAQISVFSAIEFCLWDAWDDSTNFQRNFNTGQVEVDAQAGVIYHKTEYRERRDHFAFFACQPVPVPGAAQDWRWPGSTRSATRSWDHTAAGMIRRPWRGGASFDSIAHGWQPMGSHHVKLALQPGESRQVIFLLGYHENPADDKFDPPGSQTINKRTVKPVIAKYLDAAAANAAFAELCAYWERTLDILQVATPDEHTDRMVNIWNAYQCMITFNMSRSASYFESGIGRGMGFRDSNQDLLGFVHMVPVRARERILDIAATQLPTGGAYHQYQPLTKRGNDAVGSNFNDDPLWLILGVAAYLKETGDWSILDAPVPYDNQPGSETTLFEHLQHSIQYTLDRLGPHGLPLIGRADWNDCLNLNCFSETPGESFQTTTNQEGKVAESVFIGGLFVLAANEMARIADSRLQIADDRSQGAIQNTQYAIRNTDYAQIAAEMEASVKQHGWDGAWFRRAYDAFSRPLGSHWNEEGQIFIEPQGMCIMAGIGLDDGRAEQALASVAERLATPHGIVLQQPAYTHYYLNLGEISTYPPGYKENGGIFCHTNPWVIIAEAMAGHGDRAHDYYLRINPSAREAISDVHRCEPYVYAQMIAGRDAPTHGEAKNSWLSGTAAWNYVAITQWILGIRPDYAGLRIAPVVPASWPGFTATRVFRGVTYRIAVRRTGPGNAVSLRVDGQTVPGNLIPLPADDRTEVQVEAILG